MFRIVTWLCCALATASAFVACSAWGLSPADKCEAAKNKVAGKYLFCREKAEAKAIKTGTPADYSKCDESLALKWQTTETKGGGQCPTNGDLASRQAELTIDANRTAWHLSGGPRFVDNGDGTITDNQTGLMWEKKSADGTVHDKDNAYTWCVDSEPDLNCDGAGNPMDGTILSTFLATLNGGSGFAGYTDWRIPDCQELVSIVSFGELSPSVDATFNNGCLATCDVTACSCTGTLFYWSSSSAPSSSNACTAGFSNGGSASLVPKINAGSVRAVRGGQ